MKFAAHGKTCGSAADRRKNVCVRKARQRFRAAGTAADKGREAERQGRKIWRKGFNETGIMDRKQKNTRMISPQYADNPLARKLAPVHARACFQRRKGGGNLRKKTRAKSAADRSDNGGKSKRRLQIAAAVQ